MMATAAVDMNVTVISMNLDILEQQRGHMHSAVDEYVDKVIDAGRHWTTRSERNQSSFLEMLKVTNKAMVFLSTKCDEMKSELEGKTSDLIGRHEFIQQQQNAQMVSTDEFATLQGNGTEDNTDDVKNTHTFAKLNLESDQQTRYQDIYNQLKNMSAKQNKLEQQLNMMVNNLREDTERLKSDVGTFNQYVESGKSLLKDYSQKLESLENTVSCLSGNVNEMHSDHQVLIDRINSHLSAKDDQGITDLSAKVDQITTDLTDKIGQVNKDLSENVGQVNTGLTEKLLDVSQKLADLSVTVATTCAKTSDLGAVGFSAATTLPSLVETISIVGMFEPPIFIAGCQFNTEVGTFTASSSGVYLASVRMYLYEDRYSCVSLIRQYTEVDEHEAPHEQEAEICSVQAERTGSTASSLDIVTMEEGDRLFIAASVHTTATCRIQFLCFRIG